MGFAFLCNGLSYANEPAKFIVMALAFSTVNFFLMINHARHMYPYGCERARRPATAAPLLLLWALLLAGLPSANRALRSPLAAPQGPPQLPPAACLTDFRFPTAADFWYCLKLTLPIIALSGYTMVAAQW